MTKSTIFSNLVDMKTFKFKLLTILASLVICSGATAESQMPSFENIDADRIQLHNLTIDKTKREVRLRVRLAIDRGILEYLLVGDHGKTYESAFKIDLNRPSELHFALLLIGSEPIAGDRLRELLQDPNGEQLLLAEHGASLLELEIRRHGNPVPLETLLNNREPAPSRPLWVFSGGFFLPDNRYAGDLELSYIGIWPDPSAVINLFSNLKNPYRGVFGFEINRDNAGIAVNQEYDIVIRRRKSS